MIRLLRNRNIPRLMWTAGVAVALAVPAIDVRPAHAAAEPASVARQTIQTALPRIVKLHGAGGFRGLDSYGTGFLASGDGIVVTSWGPLLDADPLTAVLDDGRRFEAKLVGADPDSGLAVLKLENVVGTLPHFDITAASHARPGERIVALSNMFRVAAGDEPVSVMHGSILAHVPLDARRGRFEVDFEGPVYIIDAVTNNPGAAGGVVLTIDGRLVGMIGRELRSASSEIWVNYAVPIAQIAPKITAIVDGRPAETNPAAPAPVANRRPLDVGLVMVPNVTARTPAYVTEVLADTPAADAGLQRDDLILFAAGSPVRSLDELNGLLSRAEAGDEFTIVVRRNGKLETFRLTVPR